MGATLFLLGKVAFAAIGIAVGCNLAARIRHSGEMGLHTIALAALGIGGLGLLAMPMAGLVGSEALSLAGEVAVRIGLLLLCFFVALTFRSTPVGFGLATLLSVLLIVTLAWDVTAQPSLLRYDYRRPSSHANQLVAALPFAWSALESGAEWLRARRRMRLGLCDPAVAERFALWSLTTGCFVAIALLAVAAGAASAAGARGEADLAHGLRGALYLAISALVWRGMFGTQAAQAGSAAGA